MNGIIIIDKKKGSTSHDIVYQVKKIFGEKVGHTGTLDPMATGVLPLLIGKGTQCSKYLINHDKTYKATIQLGEKTDTADSEGKVIEEKNVDLEVFNEEKIKQVLESFKGKQKQTPPIYSAIKVDGRKLYEYARKGQSVEIRPREIEIYNIKLLELDKENKRIQFQVQCSKGTYIRTLCEDIATKLNTVGYMKELQRTQVGEFLIENSITIDDLKEHKDDIQWINEQFIDIEEFFSSKKDIELSNKKLELFLNGVKLTYEIEDGIYRIYNNSKFVGTGIVSNHLLKRDIVL